MSLPRPPDASGLRRALGSFFWSGLAPKAPGTWGSLATVLVVVLLVGVDGGPGVLGRGLLPADRGADAILLAFSVALVAITLGGIPLGDRAKQDWGQGDPGAFVLDETAGQLIPLLPLLPGPMDPTGVVVAFLAFRLFDITKPPPIRRLERLEGGLGIMADDLAAGLAALIPVVLLT